MKIPVMRASPLLYVVRNDLFTRTVRVTVNEQTSEMTRLSIGSGSRVGLAAEAGDASGAATAIKASMTRRRRIVESPSIGKSTLYLRGVPSKRRLWYAGE